MQTPYVGMLCELGFWGFVKDLGACLLTGSPYVLNLGPLFVDNSTAPTGRPVPRHVTGACEPPLGPVRGEVA